LIADGLIPRIPNTPDWTTQPSSEI
jgi:hypothetical protein